MNETIVIFDGAERGVALGCVAAPRGRRRVGRPEGGPVAPEGLGRDHRRAPSAGAAGAAIQAVVGRWKRAAPARAHVCHEPSAATLERVLLCGPVKCSVVVKFRVL